MRTHNGAEQAITNAIMQDSRWTHAVSYTVHNCESAGQIWIRCYEAMERLLAVEPTADFHIGVCRKHPLEHFHGHGVIKSRLHIKPMRSLFRGGRAEIKRLYGRAGWANYVSPQYLTDTIIDRDRFEGGE
jgi:hypothetical protein